MTGDLQDKTIADFGHQWIKHRTNEGYYGSIELFQDIFGPLLDIAELQGLSVAEIGSGTGRIVRMLLQAGVKHVVAIEPSDAIGPLRENTAHADDQVEILHTTGENIPEGRDFDIVLSIGVIHHIPDPEPVLIAALKAIKPGGRIYIWVYGQEGNGAYLSCVQSLRAITTRLPKPVLSSVSHCLNVLLDLYIALCRVAPLPLSGYVRNVLRHMDREKRFLVIYDQLNPAYAKYYRKNEVKDLLSRSGFDAIRTYHRHGYSWTAEGRRPLNS